MNFDGRDKITCPKCGGTATFYNMLDIFICQERGCDWEGYDENEYEPPKNKVEIIEGDVDKV